MVALVGFRQTIPFERPARFTGKGNYNRYLDSLYIGLKGAADFKL